MKPGPNAWVFLRPLLLALATAASWIALSATGASADSSASSGSLPGADASTLISAPATVEDVTGLVDQVLQTAPVVEELVPEGTVVAAVVDPAVGTGDGVLDGAVGTLVPLAGAVLEPFDPVLEPVISVLPLPAAAPEAEGTPPVVADVPPMGDETAAHPAETAAETAGAVHDSAQSVRHDTLLSHSPHGDPSVKPTAVTPLLSAAGPEDPVDAPPQAPADALPAMPGAATGGSSPSGGNGPTMPAWLTSHNLQTPAAGVIAVQDGLPTVPAPGSSDPGSSPD